MKIDPRQLEVVSAVVDRGGLTEGALFLGKSQPSVSRTISQLELRLGAPLFAPGRRPLQPTELGRALAEAGRQIHSAGRTATQILGRFRTGQQGIVRVGGTPVFMDGVIATMIAEFQQRCPDVRVDQSYAYADELLARIRARTLDLAIFPMPNGSEAENLVFEPILPGLNVITCRLGHPLMRRAILTPADIAEFPWIAPPVESPLYRDLQRALEGIGTADFKISYTGGTLSSVISVLTGSDALTVLPYSVVFMFRRQRNIAALSLRIAHPKRDLGLLHDGRNDRNPALNRLRKFLTERFESLAQNIIKHQREALWRDGR